MKLLLGLLVTTCVFTQSMAQANRLDSDPFQPTPAPSVPKNWIDNRYQNKMVTPSDPAPPTVVDGFSSEKIFDEYYPGNNIEIAARLGNPFNGTAYACVHMASAYSIFREWMMVSDFRRIRPESITGHNCIKIKGSFFIEKAFLKARIPGTDRETQKDYQETWYGVDLRYQDGRQVVGLVGIVDNIIP